MNHIFATAAIAAVMPFGTGDPINNEPPDVDNGQCALVGADFRYAEATMSDPEGDTVESATLFVYVNPVSTSNHLCQLTLTPEQARMIVDAANGVAGGSDVYLP